MGIGIQAKACTQAMKAARASAGKRTGTANPLGRYIMTATAIHKNAASAAPYSHRPEHERPRASRQREHVPRIARRHAAGFVDQKQGVEHKSKHGDERYGAADDKAVAPWYT